MSDVVHSGFHMMEYRLLFIEGRAEEREEEEEEEKEKSNSNIKDILHCTRLQWQLVACM